MAASILASPQQTLSLDFEQVRNILAHRFPFLMIDRVLSVEPGKRIHALRNVSGNEIHFLGHFPNHAILPGVLMVEAMAQAVSILDTLSRNIDARTGETVAKYLSNVNVRFLKPVVPGDQMEIEADIVKQVEYGIVASAVVKTAGTVAAKGELVLGKRQGT
jgi:3-hydroxyacyl-[acyl-carrier-protein] dehydratase